MKTLKKILFRLVLLAIVIAAGWASYNWVQGFAERQRDVASAVVERGDVVVRAYTRGELRAVRSSTLTAPNLRGTTQVTRLAPLGAYAREGDLIAEFDDAEVRTRVEEEELELEQTDESIRRSEMELAIRASQDEVELLSARYTVRRAELEVQRNELLADIDAKKNTLNLDEAQRRLDKLKSDIESRRAQQEASLAVLRQDRARAEIELQRDRDRLNQVRLISPMNGLVAIRQQRTNFFFAGSQIPDIREGDELRPGMPVADILDLSELEIVARVGEVDRANLNVGQDAIIRLDALADKEIPGKIKSLSATATSDAYSNDPAKKFDVLFEVDMRALLEALDASPEQIEQTLAQAEANRQRIASGSGRSSGGAGGGDMMAAMMAAAQAGRGGAEGFAGRGGAAGAEGASGRGFTGFPGGAEGFAPPGGEAGQGGATGRGSGTRTGTRGAGGRGTRGARGGDTPGEASGGAAGARGGASAAASAAAAQRAANAQLPSPPGEDTNLDILLRPGLLADVEIIVETIPNAIHVPAQAVFEREGQPIVFVQSDGKFLEREVTLSSRSESTMVISNGLQEGEVIALADPNARPGEESAAPAAINPVQAMPGGNMPMGMPMMRGGGGGRGGGGRGR